MWRSEREFDFYKYVNHLRDLLGTLLYIDHNITQKYLE